MTDSDLIAIGSLVVAGCAFGTTVYQSWLARRHNMLSVRPILQSHLDQFVDDRGAGMRFSIRNVGTGPALVRDCYFSRDGVRNVRTDLSLHEVDEFITRLLGQRFPYRIVRSGLPGRGGAIAIGADVVVAEIVFAGYTAAQVQTVYRSLGSFALHIQYESVYGESFVLNQG